MAFFLQIRTIGTVISLFTILIISEIPINAVAQSVDSAVVPRPSFISVSPVELIYKTMIGYEHRVGRGSSLGILGSYCYGNFNTNKGYQATGYYRNYLQGHAPTGLYIQLQVSVLDFVQTANLIDIKTRQPFAFDYRAISGGGGIGIGYRNSLFRRASSGHLLYNVLVGLRGNPRPKPSYDNTAYHLESNFLGPDFGWYMGFGPGSIMHGLLTVDYQF
jgi:hypothetical protein